MFSTVTNDENLKTRQYVDISESVIISDLLCYVLNKLKSAPAKTVASICHQFYTDDDYVYNEKKKLCVTTDEYCSPRRTDDKRMKNIEDICTIIMQRDSKNDFLPQFASINLNNIPVSNEGDPSLGQIMASLNDLKKKAVTKEMLSESLSDFKNEFKESSSNPSSQSLPWSSDEQQIQPSAPPLPISPSGPPDDDVVISSASLGLPAVNLFVVPSAPLVKSSSTATVRRDPYASAAAQQPLTPNPLSNVRRQQNQGKDGKGKINPRSRESSRPRTIIGKSVKDGLISVKGANLTVNRYVGRWHNDVTSVGVKDYIAKQKVSVVELEELETKHGRFKSFRLRVKRNELSLIEDEDFWPAGVILSPFFRGRDEKLPINGAVGGVAASSNTS